MKCTKKELERGKKYRLANREKINERARLKRKNDPWESKKYHYRKLYGITPQQYETIFKEQNGRCAICDREEVVRSLSVDHCHDTNRIRGLLCLNCNAGLGNFMDNVSFLAKAIEYLALNSNK